ncbi:hypothetical protein [Nocardia transvalensis]|uniref:hypothetical protein n=1 Tax=Nocardia transvalensis TaxID=37333 RepID=UPI0018952B1C|nr:hypothetical protein [Nocardia transvalensis]MBF6330360.1 hypothetical protein [Nocardia transvalensis]
MRAMSGRLLAKCIGIIGVATVAPLVSAGSAQADTPDAVFFRYGDVNCSITRAGVVGCDLGDNVSYVSQRIPALDSGSAPEFNLPYPFKVREVVIDSPALPAHPTLGPGTSHTLPGGNPDWYSVSQERGPMSHQLDFGGATCSSIEFHTGRFGCSINGHSIEFGEGQVLLS